MRRKRYPCPCCGFDTLDAAGISEVCRICFWEDERELSGTKLALLVEAQHNFKGHGHVFPAGAGIVMARYPTPARRDLIRYALNVVHGREPDDPVLLEALLLAEEISSMDDD